MFLCLSIDFAFLRWMCCVQSKNSGKSLEKWTKTDASANENKCDMTFSTRFHSANVHPSKPKTAKLKKNDIESGQWVCIVWILFHENRLASSILSYYQNLHQHDKYMVLSFCHSVRKVNAKQFTDRINPRHRNTPAHTRTQLNVAFSECKLHVTAHCKRRLAKWKMPNRNTMHKRCERDNEKKTTWPSANCSSFTRM